MTDLVQNIWLILCLASVASLSGYQTTSIYVFDRACPVICLRDLDTEEGKPGSSGGFSHTLSETNSRCNVVPQGTKYRNNSENQTASHE